MPYLLSKLVYITYILLLHTQQCSLLVFCRYGGDLVVTVDFLS